MNFETLQETDLKTIAYGSVLWNVNNGSLVRVMSNVAGKLPGNLEELNLDEVAGKIATIFSQSANESEKDVTYRELLDNYNHIGSLFETLPPNFLAAIGFLMTDITGLKMMLQGAANASGPSKYKMTEGGIITD